MSWSLRRRGGFVVALLAVFCTVVLLVCTGHGSAIGLDFYDDSSGGGCDLAVPKGYSSRCGSDTVALKTMQSTKVNFSYVHARAYYVLTDAQYASYSGGDSLEIAGYNFCPGNAVNSNKADVLNDGYYDGNSPSPLHNYAITQYQVGTHTVNGEYKLATEAGCKGSANETVNITKADLHPAPGIANLYYVNFDSYHVDRHGAASGKILRDKSQSDCTTASDPGCDGLNDGFSLVARGSHAKYVTTANNDGNCSAGLCTTVQTSSNNSVSYVARFGSDCTVPAAGEATAVYFYDLDYTKADPVKVTIHDITAKNWLWGDNNWKSSQPSFNQLSNAPSANSAASALRFKALPNHKYELYIMNVSPGLVMQYGLPYDGIYYAYGCDNGWNMTGTSKVSAPTVQACGSVTWTHNVKNSGNEDSPTISGNVYWSGGKSGVVSPSRAYSQVFKAGQTVTKTFSYTVPCGTRSGTQFCQYINWSKTSATKPAAGNSTKACVTVSAAGATARYVVITPYASAYGGDVEPTVDAPFGGGASVSGFPETKDWGYTESSKQLPALRVNASSRSTLQVRSKVFTTPSTVHYHCPSGYSLSGSTCKKKGASNKAASRTYTCPSGYNLSGATCSRTLNSHKCEYDATWGAYGGASPTCKPYWTCPGGAAGSGYSTGAVTCSGWQCQYSPYSQVNQTNAPACQSRCGGGKGATWGPLSTGTLHNGGDTNCYIQPSFTLSCQWSDRNGAAISGVYSSTVAASGSNYCPSQISRPSSIIGDTICVTYTAFQPTGWNTNPAPGTTKKETWGFRVGSASTACTRVSGKPYLKVYGSDVRVGGGVGKTDATCGANNSAGIAAWNRADYAGAGAQYAVMALSTIDGFASAQYNNLADQSVGSDPTALTFANTSGGYGGNWDGGGTGGVPPCLGYVADLPATATNLTGSQSIASMSLSPGTSKVVHVTGDVFIAGNIVYLPGWTMASSIPQYQLVVEGNIYISSNVTQLDGLYAAVPTSATSGGNIYTCASGIGSPITATFGSCKKQLVINGAFGAKHVAFQRDCGSLIRSQKIEPTTYTGGTDDQFCSAANHAAEVFNYSPEQWIRSAAGPTSNVYDAISSLPPVL